MAERSDAQDAPDRLRFSYDLYGVTLRSQWELPFAPALEQRPPVIELLEGSPSLFEGLGGGVDAGPKEENWFNYTCLKDGRDYFRWAGFYEFLISADGRRIFGRPFPGVSQESFLFYLVAGGISFCLLKLGVDPLHATVVAVHGKAVGFLGGSGYGKSTLLGSFLRAGYPVVTDDMLVLKKDILGYSAYHGPAHIKLSDKIAAPLLGERASGIPMNPLAQKLIIPLEQKKSRQSLVPLKCFYILRRPDKSEETRRITIRPLSQRRGLLALLRSSYNYWVSDPARLNRQLIQYAQIAAQVPVKMVSYPRQLAKLPAVRDAILADFVR